MLASTASCFAQTETSQRVVSVPEKPLSYAGQRAVSAAKELIALKNYKDAMKQANVAIRADPKSGIPHMVKAYIHGQQDEPKKATDSYVKALSLSPTNGYVLNNYAQHLCKQKQHFELADANFLKATKDSNYPMAHQSLENAASCALKNDDMARAELRARAALFVKPDSASALETLAQVNARQSKFLEARAFLQRREALGPLGASLLELASQIEKSAGDDRAAAGYKKQLDILLQAQVQPPTGEGQKKP